MKNLLYIIFFIYLIFQSVTVRSQCNLTAGINGSGTERLEVCAGTLVDLQATGICNYLMSNNFNNGQIGTGWQSNCSPMFNNPCGAGSDGTTYLWIGSASSFPRDLVTAPFDVSAGGCQICFDMRFAIQGQNSPCEGPDEVDEGVELQYSVNGGAWQSIIYFRPDGQTFSYNQWVGQGSSVGSGNTAFTGWHNYCYTVPAGGISTSTRFRWHQEQVTDNDYDHWGLDNVNIYCPAGQSITWEANPGQTGFPYSGGNVPTFAPPVGTNVYTATIVDPLNPSNTASDAVTVIVHPIPTSNFTITPVICSDQTATVTYTGTGSSTATYNWDFNGGTVVSGSGQGPYQVSWPAGGNYNVTLSVSEYNCISSSTSMPITVNQQPTSDFTVTDPVCNDANSVITYRGNATLNASYNWNFSGGTVISGSNAGPYHINWQNAGLYDVTLQVTENNCVSINTTMQVTVYAVPSSTFDMPQTICSDYDALISCTGSGTPNASYTWDFDGGNIISGSGSGPYAINWVTAGTHNVSLTVTENNCTSTTTLPISVYESPDAAFRTNRLDGCEPLNIQFSDNSIPASLINMHSWSFGDGGNSSVANPNHVYSDGIYTVTLIVMTREGCYDTLTKTDYLTVYKTPRANASALPTIATFSDDLIIYFDGSSSIDASTWNWDFNDGTGVSPDSSISHHFAHPGAYDVVLTVTSEHGCIDSSKITIVIQAQLVIPNVITPNNDGINDYFDITYLDETTFYLTNTLTIYNRWGAKVYQKQNYLPDSDKWNAEGLPDGTYFFVLAYKSVLQNGEITGSLTVLRGK